MKNAPATYQFPSNSGRRSTWKKQAIDFAQRARPSRFALLVFTMVAGLGDSARATDTDEAIRYAVVVSKATIADQDWNLVTQTLLHKYEGERLTYRTDLLELVDELADIQPTHVCLVARPSEAGRDAIAKMHSLCRQLDEDPYYDCLWGVITGWTPSDALRIAKRTEPLTVHRVGSGTEVALEVCQEGQWFCELEKGKHVVKEPDGEVTIKTGPADTTAALASLLTDYQADLFVTSGHATERDWQIGYRYRNGSFRSKAGKLYGRDTKGQAFPIQSDHPRVYLPIGNCLMGHIDGPDAMALAWMHSAGVQQMIGYTVPTWYGYAGWGMLDYFVEQPGRYSFAEAFYVNQQALMHRLTTYFPAIARQPTRPGQMRGQTVTCGETAKLAGLSQMDGNGLLFDRDVVAFYGDPAWEARMADGPLRWNQSIFQEGDRYTFEIQPLQGMISFDTVNSNGAQRGGRPIIQRFPKRLRNVKILSGQEFNPLIADDFILVPLPTEKKDQAIRIVFSANSEVGE